MNTVIHFGQMLVVPSLPILARLWRSAVKQRIGQRFRGPNGDPRIMFVDPDTSEVDSFNLVDDQPDPVIVFAREK